MNLKSWKTTAIGVIALIGLGFNAYTNGGFSVADFLLLITGIGFLAAKDGNVTNSSNGKLYTKGSALSARMKRNIGGDSPIEEDGHE
jgi:hypothetical protein